MAPFDRLHTSSIPNRFWFWHRRVVSVCQELFLAAMCVAVFGFYDGGAINLSVRCVGASAAFCAVCVILSVNTPSASVPAAFPFTSLSPLLHRRARARGSGRSVVGRRRLFVCHRMQRFLTGLFHDIFIFNIDG